MVDTVLPFDAEPGIKESTHRRSVVQLAIDLGACQELDGHSRLREWRPG